MKTALLKRIRSFGYAFRGIALLLLTQPNARIHLLATALVITAGWYFEVSATEWLILVLTMTIVWVAEGLNTAVEFLTDLTSPGFHPLAGRAKDVAAGAVLLAAIGAVVIAALIFGPKIF